ncbi:MAG TPA: putative glycoside hydrolase [Gaiellaceae bacterium]|nr:putative glycoside hydrolase [Gaiellaceae bacterium]
MTAVHGEELAGRAESAITELRGANASAAPLDVREHERLAKELVRAPTADLRSAGRTIRALCAENAALGGGDEPLARARPARKPRYIPWKPLALGLAALVLLGGVAAVAARAAAPELGASGPATDALIGLDDLATLSFSATSSGATWELDGRSVQPARRDGAFVYRPAKLADGEHTLEVSRDGPLFSTARRAFHFTVDTTPPILKLAQPAVVQMGQPLVLRGTVEPGASLVRGGKAITLDDEGAFEVREAAAPRSLEVLATDAAGNRSRWRVPVTVAPRRPKEPLRSVHITAYGWANDELRAGVMALVRAGKINAIELDVKDEAGEIGFNPSIARAREIKAALPIYDLGKAVKELHAQGVRVIGRLVVFRDPILAAASWKAGRRAEVIQTPGGEPYAGYGGFTNFANPAVRKYNIDVAVAAAKLGIDEILYDYVRRPDGPTDSMVFPGLRGTPEAAMVRFLAESRAALAGTDTLVGASVFGIAATRPEEVAQDIPGMAREVDYIAPMVYPSHWGPGEYEVADPNGDPYEIVLRSTEDFVRQVKGTGARVVPWLQDFSLGRTYGANEVRAQIKGARDAGADEFILWDAAVTYTSDGLDPGAELPALGVDTGVPKNAPGPIRLPL